MSGKEIVFWAIMAAMGIALIWGLMWMLRIFSNSVTTVTVEEVRDGVECAKMVTADGAAIDCWYTPQIAKHSPTAQQGK